MLYNIFIANPDELSDLDSRAEILLVLFLRMVIGGGLIKWVGIIIGPDASWMLPWWLCGLFGLFMPHTLIITLPIIGLHITGMLETVMNWLLAIILIPLLLIYNFVGSFFTGKSVKDYE